MFFRFGSALCLVVVIALAGIAIEKHNLDLRRDISRQHFQMDILKEEHNRLRLRSQRLAAVDRLFETVTSQQSDLQPPVRPADPQPEATPRVPLLFWQQPVKDPRHEPGMTIP